MAPLLQLLGGNLSIYIFTDSIIRSIKSAIQSKAATMEGTTVTDVTKFFTKINLLAYIIRCTNQDFIDCPENCIPL